MNKDQALAKGLIKMLDEATFPLKAREVASFAAIYNWVRDELPLKLETSEKKEDTPEKKEDDGPQSK